MDWRKWQWTGHSPDNEEHEVLTDLRASMKDVYQKLKSGEYSEARERSFGVNAVFELLALLHYGLRLGLVLPEIRGVYFFFECG